MNRLAKIALLAGLGGLSASALLAAPSDAPNSSELASKSIEIQARAGADLQHVTHLQAMARRSKDVIKLNCVNDKLTLIRPSLNIIDRLTVEIRSSAEGATAFSQCVSAGENIRRLREEADQCAGEPMSATTSWNDYTAPTVPDSPYGNPWGTYNGVVEPPNYASPFD